MASFAYNLAATEIFQGGIDPDTDTLKVMLVGTGYTPDQDHDVIDNGANDATDPSFSEIVATGYTGGFGGAGRKTAAIVVAEDDANNRALITITDLTWASLGGATNDTIATAILVKEITDDTASRLICQWDVADTATNGSPITLDFDATNGAIRVNCVST